jgi:hypothetical protein
MSKCISGKKTFNTEAIAEDVLIELWTRNDYVDNQGPIAVYKCDDCGLYHLTSRPPMNEKLKTYLGSGQSKLDKEAFRWLGKFKKK